MMQKIRSFFVAAISLAAMFVCSSAWAATPVAVWDGDFTSLTSGGCTITLNGNEYVDDARTGLKITTTQSANANGLCITGFSGKQVTLLVGYTNLTIDSTTRSLMSFGTGSAASNADNVGICSDTTNSKGIVQSGYWTTTTGTAVPSNGDEINFLALTSDQQDGSNTGTKGYINTGSEWTMFYNAGGLKASNTANVRAGIGGNTVANGSRYNGQKIAPATGMIIKKIAVFTSLLDANTLAAYKWPTKWIGGEGNWSDAANWSDGVPVANQTAIIPAGAVVTVDGTIASGVTVQGAGTIVFTATDATKTAAPTAPSGLTTSAWTGTVWLKGYGKGVLNSRKDGGNVGFKLDNYGNTGSTVALTGIEGYLLINGTGSANGTTQLKNVELIDEENVVAFTQNNGNSSDVFVFPKLSGNGTFSDGALSGATQGIRIVDGSEFTGSISLTMGRRIGFGNNIDTKGQKSIYVSEGSVVTVGDASIWTATDGIKVFGTLGGAGTLASATTFGDGAKIRPAVGGLKFGSTITGSVTIDCADIVAAGVNGSALITMTGSTKTLPTYTLENATGFEAFAKDGVLYLVNPVMKSLYAPFVANFANRMVTYTWSATGTAEVGSDSAVFVTFNPETLEEPTTLTDGVTSYYGGNTHAYKNFPGYTKTANDLRFWHAYCRGQGGFDSPGLAIRFPAYKEGNYVGKITTSFSPFSLAGLMVEPGACNGNSTYSFEKNDTQNRNCELGDYSGTVPTYFIIGENFALTYGGMVTLYGDITIDVKEGKTFTINKGAYNKERVLNSGSTLHMVGGGSLVVDTTTFNASGATLDYSALELERTTPFITGNLTVDANTTFKFPVGFEPTSEEKPSSYKLCSGTITGPERIPGANIYVGGVKLSGKELIFDLQNGKVSYQDITAPKITVTEDISITDVEGKVTSGYTGLVELDFESDRLALIIDKAIPFSSILLKCDGLVTLAAEDEDGAYVPTQADFDKLNWNDVSVANKRIYRNIAPFGSAPAAGMTYRYEGTKTLAAIPYVSDSVAGTIEVDCPVADNSGELMLAGNKNIVFGSNFSATFAGCVSFGGAGNITQTITQNGGILTANRTGDGGSCGNSAFIPARYPVSVTYNLLGGVFSAPNGQVQYWDGTPTINIGGGSASALFTTKGIHGTDKNNTSVVNVNANGTLEIGNGGVAQNSNDKIALNGGTYRATATQTISGGALGFDSNSTFDVANDTTLTMAPTTITGNGAITKIGAGTLKFDNSHHFYGSQRNDGTALVIAGGTLDLNGAYTWSTDGSGFLTQKSITLGGIGATTITGGNVTFYSDNSNNIIYNGGDGANAPAEFAANWHSSYSNGTYTRNINVGKGAGTDYDLLISGAIGILGGQFGGTTIHKTGVGTVKMTGAFNMPALSIDEGTWKMGADKTTIATLTVASAGTISSEIAASINITSSATISGNISGVSLVSQGGTITVAEGATVGESVGFVVDLDEAVIGATPFAFADDSFYGKVTTKGDDSALTYDPITHTIVYNGKTLSDTMIWLPIGDSITEGEQHMGHPGQGDVNTRGGYRYQLYSQLTAAGMDVRSVGYRTGHMATVESDDCPWAWHAAQYGGVIAHDSNGTHGGALFNVENTLQVAGYPDVITILLGVNDLSMGNPSAANIYDSMDAMVKKIAKMRPNSKILVSTILPAGGSRGYIDTYNTLLREKSTQVASPFNLPNVKLIDVNAKFGAYADAYFKSDNLHPNEVGSIKVAKAFMGFVATAIGEIVDGDTKMVHVHNGESGYVVVRFSKVLADGATATLTIAGTDVDGNAVELVFENGAVDTDDKRVMRFAIPQDTTLKGGVYTATLSAIDTTTLASDFVEIQGAGAAENIGAAYRKDFLRYGTVTFSNGTITDGIGSGDNWQGNGPTIQVDRSDVEGVDIKRVGYYLELKRANEPSQFVWVSMDAFNTSLSNLLVPTAASGAHKAKVTTLQVYANRANVTNTAIDNGVVDTTQTGVVEFTPWGWNGNEQAGYPNDIYSSRTGWNDTLEMSAGTLKGGMQVFRYTDEATVDTFTKFAAETVFAVNNFNCDTAMDLGIGSFSTHRNNAGGNNTIACTWDWSDFVNNSKYTKFAVNAYEVKKMEIWVVPMTKTVWMGEGADNNWNTAENWSTGAVPASYADVEIPANAAIVLNDDIAIASLTVTDASASITGTGSIKVTNLAASTLKGVATIALPEGEIPNADMRAQLSASDWKGTIIIKNYGSFRASDGHVGIVLPSDMVNWGNSNSKVQFTGVFACLPDSDASALTIPWELVLIDNETPYLNYTHAWYNDNGYSKDTQHSFAKLSGSGTFYDSFGQCLQIIKFGDVSEFTGMINIAGKRLIIGNTEKMTDAGSIAIADGAIVNAGVLTASKIKFGATIKIPNATLDQVFVTGLTAEPTSIPGVLDAAGNDVKNLALAYEAGTGGAPNVIRLVAAGAKTDDGKNYETIEQAINANDGATIAIAKDTELDLDALTAGKVFKLNAAAIASNKIGWSDIAPTEEANSGKYLACNSEGVLTVETGKPKGEFTSFECYVLGISTESADKPVLNAPPDDGKADTLTVTLDTFRNIKGVKLIAVPNDQSETIEATGKSIPLSLPGTGERIYTIKVDTGSAN